MVLVKIVSIFLIIFVGYGANKIGWLPVAASKYLSKIVINIATPCIVIISMAGKERTTESLKAMLTLVVIFSAGYLVMWLVSLVFAKIAKIPKIDRGIYNNFLMFSNNGFMGFPVAYAIFGAEGMFYMAIINCISPIVLFTYGVATLKRSANEEKNKFNLALTLKNIVNAPLIGVFIGLIVFLLEIPIHAELNNLLTIIGGMMTPLSMIVIGIQLSNSKIGEVAKNWRLLLMTAFRLVIIPLTCFVILLPFNIDNLILAIVLLNFLLPCAASLVAITEEYGGNARLAAEGIFLSTLFSLITVPIATILLTMLY